MYPQNEDLFLQGNTIWIGGNSPWYAGYSRYRIAQVDLSTGFATCWDPGFTTHNLNYVSSIYVQNDTVYAGNNGTLGGGGSYFMMFTGHTVVPTPVISGPNSVVVGQSTTFSSTPSSGYSNVWYYSDGNYYNSAGATYNINVTWNQPGTDTLFLYTRNNNGCKSDTVKKIITVNPDVDTLMVTGTSTWIISGTANYGPFCSGDTFDLYYNALGYNLPPSIPVIAQLSDSNGSFSNPLNIGSGVCYYYQNNIRVIIPSNVPSGSNYRFRVVGISGPFLSIDGGGVQGRNQNAYITTDTACANTATNVFLNTNSLYVTNAEWYINGNLTTYTGSQIYQVINNGDVIQARVTGYCVSNLPYWSNRITAYVIPNHNNFVSINASPAFAVCSGSQVTYTASQTDTTAVIHSIDWFLNGQQVASGASYSAALNDNDSVRVRINFHPTAICPYGYYQNSYAGFRIRNLSVADTIMQSICSGQTFAGYNASGTYIDTFNSTNGCDSIRTLYLTVLPPITTSVSQTICQGQTYLGYSATGSYSTTYIAANGCDSIRTLNLTVLPISRDTLAQIICADQSYLGYTVSGSFADTFTATNGCDSIRVLNLQVLPNVNDTLAITIANGQNYYNYNAAGNYIDTFAAANGCDSIRWLNLIVLPPMDTVWPGDANADGVADNTDLLNIGIAYGYTGPSRQLANSNWTGQACPLWTNNFIGGENYNNADCNGDGIVDAADSGVVLLNYGFIHPKNNASPRSPNSPALYFVPVQTTLYPNDTCTLLINLGESNLQVSQLYGIAFKTNVDHGLITPGTLTVDYTHSWIGNRNTDLMTVTKDFVPANHLDIGVCRDNHINKNGYGEIARISFIVGNYVGNQNALKFPISFVDITAIDSVGNIIPIDTKTDTLLIQSLYNSVENISGGDVQLSLIPNPSSGNVTITSNEIIEAYTVVDARGQKLTEVNNIGSIKAQFDATKLANGVYLIQAIIKGQIITRRLIILH